MEGRKSHQAGVVSGWSLTVIPRGPLPHAGHQVTASASNFPPSPALWKQECFLCQTVRYEAEGAGETCQDNRGRFFHPGSSKEPPGADGPPWPRPDRPPAAFPASPVGWAPVTSLPFREPQMGLLQPPRPPPAGLLLPIFSPQHFPNPTLPLPVFLPAPLPHYSFSATYTTTSMIPLYTAQ